MKISVVVTAMKSNTFEIFVFSGLLALLAAGQSSLWAASSEGPYTSKFQGAQPPKQGDISESGGDQKIATCGRHHKKAFKKCFKCFPVKLSEEEREHSDKIHEKIEQNPEVQAAREALKNAKTPEEKQQARRNLKEASRKAISPEDREFLKGLRQRMKQNCPPLTEEQKKRMQEICDKASQSPEVQKAREAMKNAQTPEERRAAAKQLKETMRKNMSPEDRAFMDDLRKNRLEKKPTQTPEN